MAALLAAFGCAGDSAGDIADRFMDHYFIEANQQKALPLAVGPARAKLERELESVKEIRKSGYGPRQARGKVFYERVSSEVMDNGKRARFVYNVSLGQAVAGDRHVIVTLHRASGWRVVNFLLRDGKAAQAAKKAE